MQYWVTAQQLSEVCQHLEGWGNSIVMVELDSPDLFMLTMQQPISPAEVSALGLTEV